MRSYFYGRSLKKKSQRYRGLRKKENRGRTGQAEGIMRKKRRDKKKIKWRV